MFRTRDFILIFTSIVFLLVAIGSTVFYQRVYGPQVVVESVTLVVTDDKEYIAEVYVPDKVSREERLADMRLRIAEGGNLAISSPEEVVVETVTEEVIDGVQSCSDHSVFMGIWPTGVKMDVVEGARIFYTESEVEIVMTPATPSSTPIVGTETVRDVLIQLSVSFGPKGNLSCLASDVVGIAQDGSLIRNNESGLYGVFGPDTIVGYALDGFPIHGTSPNLADNCGGQTVSGQYGYYISTDRDEILNCYSGTPTNI
ncbi:MAG: hypothetical protein LR008_01810 [Candidatus Pacebacteria bacterium]|nr:hypothetical protein [Candidatus Paceibacterota bacterium]